MQYTNVAKNLSDKRTALRITSYILNDSANSFGRLRNTLIVYLNVTPDKGVEHFIETVLTICPEFIILISAIKKRTDHLVPAL